MDISDSSETEASDDDYKRRVEAFFTDYNAVLKGRTSIMNKPNNAAKNGSPVEELLAQAETVENIAKKNEQEKTVPQQATAETASDVKTEAQDSGTTDEKTPKKTPGQRLDDLIAKAKTKKKALLFTLGGVGSAAIVGSVLFVKAASKTLAATEPVMSAEEEAELQAAKNEAEQNAEMA